MAESRPSDGSLLRQFRTGSPSAADLLYRRYSGRICALVRSNLSRGVSRRVDAEDIVQSVFRRLFQAASQGQYSLPSGEELWDLLVVMTLNRVRSEETFHRADKRDLRLTVALDVGLEPGPDGEPGGALYTFLAVAVDEAIEQLPEHYRQVVRLRMEGYEVAEIAGRTSRSKRTVERMLQEVRERLKPTLGAER